MSQLPIEVRVNLASFLCYIYSDIQYFDSSHNLLFDILTFTGLNPFSFKHRIFFLDCRSVVV